MKYQVELEVFVQLRWMFQIIEKIGAHFAPFHFFRSRGESCQQQVLLVNTIHIDTDTQADTSSYRHVKYTYR